MPGQLAEMPTVRWRQQTVKTRQKSQQVHCCRMLLSCRLLFAEQLHQAATYVSSHLLS